ncbi:MAG TPA: hypothetical protein VHB46_18460 [Burkholderiales bacterium]|nr:hypothetical protein [Burkholderiales bacterium]
MKTWWLALCAAAVVNVLLLAWSARHLIRRAAHVPGLFAARGIQLWLSAGYVLGCAFRSVFPMVDVPRICLHDNFISRIAVGRTIATVAELCFAIQWALLLGEAGTSSRTASIAGKLIVPIIVAAEIFSWSAVVTSNYLLHAVENSLWTLAALIGLAGFLSLRPQVEARTARFLEIACVCAGGYVMYMVSVDVPMYLARWHTVAAGDGSLPLAEGLRTLLARCIVENRWGAWQNDVSWLTLYFTIAVWVSIAITHAPRLGSSKP